MGAPRPFRRGPVASDPAPAAGPQLWVDASNYTGPLSDQQCADLKAAGVVGVIVQAWPPYCAQQLDACRRNGLRIQGYYFVYPGDTKAGLRQRLTQLDGYAIEALWCDVEIAGLTESLVNTALLAGDAYTGKRTGVYSGKWFFDQQGWSHQSYWSGRPLWDSNYDGQPVLDANFRPYGGWTSCVIKQFRGTSDVGSVHEIDLDVE